MKILTERKWNKGFSRQVVYEWEDEFVKEWNSDFEYMDSYQKHPFARLMRKMKFRRPLAWKNSGEKYLFFAMNIDLLRLLAWYLPNVIPIILDISLNEIDELYAITRKLPVFWVTSKCIYTEMKRKYPDCRVLYIPQTVSSIYAERKLEKSISFIQFGRRNPMLHEFAIRYCDENEGTSYMYRHLDASKGMVMYAGGEKKELGIVETREEFIGYLLRSKISLCSTPFMDHTRDFGENVDFFTARWYESVACGCHIIARWSDLVSEEVRKTRMDCVASNIETYDEFRKSADEYLISPIKRGGVASFLEENDARSRAKEIRSCIESII